jgi:hypothetical protein
MDIVYILGSGSMWNNTEIRMSLRSVEKHIKGYGRIFIVGEFPSFLDNKQITHIPVKDTDAKNKNIAYKLLASANSDLISDRFLYMQDDVFITQEVDLKKKLPYYFKGTFDTARKDYYGTLLNDSKEMLPQNKNFDNHYPIVIDKIKLKKAYDAYDWQGTEEGLATKSMYCQFNKIKGVERADNKIMSNVGKGYLESFAQKHWAFSTTDTIGNKHLIAYFGENYPTKCNWEIEEVALEPAKIKKGEVRIMATGKARNVIKGTVSITDHLTANKLVERGYAIIITEA